MCFRFERGRRWRRSPGLRGAERAVGRGGGGRWGWDPVDGRRKGLLVRVVGMVDVVQGDGWGATVRYMRR